MCIIVYLFNKYLKYIESYIYLKLFCDKTLISAFYIYLTKSNKKSKEHNILLNISIKNKYFKV